MERSRLREPKYDVINDRRAQPRPPSAQNPPKLVFSQHIITLFLFLAKNMYREGGSSQVEGPQPPCGPRLRSRAPTKRPKLPKTRVFSTYYYFIPIFCQKYAPGRWIILSRGSPTTLRSTAAPNRAQNSCFFNILLLYSYFLPKICTRNVDLADPRVPHHLAVHGCAHERPPAPTE